MHIPGTKQITDRGQVNTGTEILITFNRTQKRQLDNQPSPCRACGGKPKDPHDHNECRTCGGQPPMFTHDIYETNFYLITDLNKLGGWLLKQPEDNYLITTLGEFKKPIVSLT